jgi:hypothetical protein
MEKHTHISLRLTSQDLDNLRSIGAYLIKTHRMASSSRSDAVRKSLNLVADHLRAGGSL